MTTFTLIAALAAVSLAPHTAAMGEVETIRVTIEHRDLDLADRGDQRRLDRRVRAAINDACPRDRLNLGSNQRVLECRQLARAAAEGQVRIAIAQARLEKARFASTARKPAA